MAHDQFFYLQNYCWKCIVWMSVILGLILSATPAIAQYGEPQARTAAEVANFEQSCKAGNAAHCMSTASAYRRGKLVKRDLIKARSFYQRACNGKFPGGCNRYILTKQRLDKVNRAANPSPVRAARTQRPAVKTWGPNDPVPAATASFAEHVAAARGVGATALNSTECRHLRANEHIWQGGDMVRWNRLRRAWWRQPQGRRYGRICDSVPTSLATFVRNDLARLANAPRPPRPAPSSGSSGTYENSSTLRQKWQDETTPKQCYVKDGRRICY